MTAAPLSLKARALQWLAQREQSRLELRRKLLRLARRRAADAAAGAATDGAHEGDGHSAPDPQAEVDALLDWLQAHRYLSDARFVESRVNARSARYGNLRIRQELSQHGAVLDSDTAGHLRDSELARAHAVWLRKYGGTPPNGAAEQARQMRFLAGRGFSSEAVRRVVRGAAGVDDDGG